jgi:hypothetical protein
VTVVIVGNDGSTSNVATGSEVRAGDRGVTIGRRFVPWHRVERFWWDLAEAVAPEERAGPQSG